MDSNSPDQNEQAKSQINRPADFGQRGKDASTYMTDPITDQPNTTNSANRTAAEASGVTNSVTPINAPETSIPTDKKVQTGLIAAILAGAAAIFGRGHANTPSNPNVMQPPQPPHSPNQSGVTPPGTAHVDSSGIITPGSQKPVLPGERPPYPIDTAGSWNPLMADNTAQQTQSDAEAYKAMGVKPDKASKP